ncbi:hypothetical protein [Gulosibacter molinativorax]|uniref:Uncharacterized protein n=1 Tax=Gulosibacter molinativorax TaxID=256821 RepID=A0ABT7C8M2_9MICO|nr:hypothetical protein [Gulosibacter molinativorax]MDJ1371488.1 hypothetical protein [Gulosibacter molinativorax]
MSSFPSNDAGGRAQHEFLGRASNSTIEAIKKRLEAREPREYNGETAAESMRAERDASFPRAMHPGEHVTRDDAT